MKTTYISLKLTLFLKQNVISQNDIKCLKIFFNLAIPKRF